MNTFQPTYLYIKQHTETGLLYFGKSTKSHDKMLKYRGSGKEWLKHLRAYGPTPIETIWYCLFYDKEDIRTFALLCSNIWDIKNSEVWANVRNENGIQGGGSGYGPNNKGAVRTAEHRAKLAKAQLGRKMSAESSVKKQKSMIGKNKDRILVAVSCISCHKVMGVSELVQQHYKICKRIRKERPYSKVSCLECHNEMSQTELLYRHYRDCAHQAA